MGPCFDVAGSRVGIQTSQIEIKSASKLSVVTGGGGGRGAHGTSTVRALNQLPTICAPHSQAVGRRIIGGVIIVKRESPPWRCNPQVKHHLLWRQHKAQSRHRRGSGGSLTASSLFHGKTHDDIGLIHIYVVATGKFHWLPVEG